MAYISILVKSESIVSKGLEIATTPIWNVGKKLKEGGQVLIQIDDEHFNLDVSEKPYLIEVSPGEHSIFAVDLNGHKKSSIKAIMKTALYVGVSLTGGGSISDAISDGINSTMENQERATKKHSYDVFAISDGETIKYTCQVTSKGIVKLQRTR